MENQQNNLENEQTDKNTPHWERDVLEKVVMASLTEQTRARRWSVFFKSLMFIYLIAIGAMAFYPSFEKKFNVDDKEHTAVIDVAGLIAEGEVANSDSIIKGLRAALKDKKTKGVIIKINSPGGSPVQSAYVFSEILRLKEKHPDIPIYSVVTDICASGGYYIAAATDKIFVSESSMIGSIGVLMNSFGFVNLMDKIGIDRRLMVAGEHKALMDPFSPENGIESRHLQTLLDDVHQQFISAVRLGRGDRLKESEELFTGLVWTGAQGISLGLADDIGSVDSVSREIIGTKKKVNFTPHERLLDKIASKMGASFGNAFMSAINGLSLQ